MKTDIFYRGMRTPTGNYPVVHRVDTDGQSTFLDVRQDLAPHNSDAAIPFGWLKKGPPCRQLALALLADATGDDTKALRLYERFASRFVSKLPDGGWLIKAEDVRNWVLKEEGN